MSEQETGGMIGPAPVVSENSISGFGLGAVPVFKAAADFQQSMRQIVSGKYDPVAIDCGVELTPYGVEFMRKAAEEAAAYQPSNTFPTPESLRQFVDERIHTQLHGVCEICGGPLQANHLWCPGAHSEDHSIVDAGQQRRVRQFDEDGTEWRGVLYRVRKEGE